MRLRLLRPCRFTPVRLYRGRYRPSPLGNTASSPIRDLFAEAIGVPRRTVHADSDFFRLGGHPAAAARLLARARRVLGASCRAAP
ncbi:acyl carrier protein, partial [Streptomyces mirabilis]|uniref:acyl carrier protein n=1 Tax=Streptomyces mirabilis TaxID=68239 RepID=UPI0033185121